MAADTLFYTLGLRPDSRLYLTGDSTLHPYGSTSTLTQVTAVLSSVSTSTALMDVARQAPFQKFEVTVPVQGLKSGDSGLDKNLYKAMKVTQYPEIYFVLDHYEKQPEIPDSPLSFKASGRLTIAGVHKDIVLTGKAQPHNGVLLVEGQYDLRMSDYGIKPPTLLLGAIRVADPVVIHFHLLFELIKGATE